MSIVLGGALSGDIKGQDELVIRDLMSSPQLCLASREPGRSYLIFCGSVSLLGN